MSAAGYPWDVLGIEPTTDARLIRGAYAARLKHTRLDDDPAGFQKLLEARNLALDGGEIDAAGSDIAAEAPLKSRMEPDAETMVRPLADTDSSGDDDVPETVQCLKAIPRGTYPHQVVEPWLNALAAFDRSPLDQLPMFEYALFSRLVYGMAEDLGPMPSLDTLPKTARTNSRLLGPYGDVLREMEDRFSLLEQDTRLFDLLDWERGWYLFKALEIVAGDKRASRGKPVPFREVRAADAIWAVAAFGADTEMLNYQTTAVAADKHYASFSILGLLFPLPVALYYRLYSFAAWLIVISIGIVAGRISVRLGSLDYYLLWFFTFPCIGYLAAFHIPAMRLTALGRKVKALAKTEDLPSIRQKVEVWGKPNVTGMIAGIVLTAITILSFVLI